QRYALIDARALLIFNAARSGLGNLGTTVAGQIYGVKHGALRASKHLGAALPSAAGPAVALRGDWGTGGPGVMRGVEALFVAATTNEQLGRETESLKTGLWASQR